MDNLKNDGYYLERIKKDLAFIIEHMREIDLEGLCKNEVLQDSMMFRMVQISENAKKLSDLYKASRSNIPWTAIYGLRNRIVHDYGHIDLGIVYETLKTDIPELYQLMRNDEHEDRL